jgi:hypothetical protein
MRRKQIFISSVQREFAYARDKLASFINNDPYWSQFFKAIKKTATRDLKDLVAKGVLEQRGTRGPGVHYVLATNRDKMGTIGTSPSRTSNRDKIETKETLAKTDNKPSKRKK